LLRYSLITRASSAADVENGYIDERDFLDPLAVGVLSAIEFTGPR